MQQKPKTIFAGIADALNASRRKKSTIDPNSPGMGTTQTMPSLNPEQGVENMQQQFLDWQSHKISHDLYTRTVYYDTDRISAYQDFRAMDGTPEIAAALNIIRDECLTRGEKGGILEVYSEDKRVKQVLNDLFKNVLNVDFNLRLWIRDLVKYGDYFVKLDVDKEVGIYDFITLPMEEVHREEGFDGRTSSTRFRWETTGDYFVDWQVAHFRLLEDGKKLPYGRSLLDSSRKLWKQLQLAEDAMLVYRITRAPERRVFYIEVGNLPDTDVKQYMGKVQNQIRKQPIVDVRTGNMTQKYDPENVTEDFWIPIRGDKSSKIETLPGACLSLDTKIELLDGRSLKLSEIIEEYKQNKNLWTYSINPKTGEMVPGKISWAGVTRKNADVVKITLDNGEEIVCTPDHKFPTRFNGEKEAKDLKAGESMWAFNKKFEKIKGAGKKRVRNTYEMIYDHKAKGWKYTHRIIANYFKDLNLHNVFSYLDKFESLEKNTIHHSDFNRYNNSPENLCFMNSEDHFYYHHDNMKNLVKYFGEEKIEQWKKDRKKGLDKYWENISEEEMAKKISVSIENFKKGSDKLQEMLKDEEYKKAFYEKTSKILKIVKNTEFNKNRQSKYAKAQWKTKEFRDAVRDKQTIKYSDVMLQFVVNKFKEGLSAQEILKEINCENSSFMIEFNNLNEGNKQLEKMKNGFTHNNLYKMMQHFGYGSWRGFKRQVEFFNHKIVSVEFLQEKQDTGTLTIDKDEIYHDFHNFALSCGIYTKNSNLGDIHDIEYLQNKLFAALQVPKTYLNFGESMPGGSTLSQADIRFSRTINSIQEAILLELRRVANIHLYFLGFNDDLDNFHLTLTNPSTQQELLKLETMKARLEVFKEFFNTEATAPSSYTWAMENILGFSKSDIKLMLKQKKVEKKIFAEIESAVETYKKIGLFDDLDSRYEDPEAAAALAAGGGGAEGDDAGGGDAGGGFGGGSSLGGLGGGFDMGGGAGEAGGGEMGAEAPPEGAEAGVEEEPQPLAESKINKAFKNSDRRMNSLINELLGEEDVVLEKMKEAERRRDSSLVKNNNNTSLRTKKLIESIDKNLNKINVEGTQAKVITESEEYVSDEVQFEDEVQSDNVLFENNERNNEKTKALFDDLDKIISNEDE